MENATVIPRWVVVRLGNDLNWWVEESSDEMYWPDGGLSILDPRQLNDICERLEEYLPHGFQPESFRHAFAFFEVQSELDNDRLRLRPTRQPTDENRGKLFAMPLFESEDKSGYLEFAEHLTVLRVKYINVTHRYAQEVDPLDLEEELNAEENDLYFGGEGVHCYDELNDILSWSPAEWDGEQAHGERHTAAEHRDDEDRGE